EQFLPQTAATEAELLATGHGPEREVARPASERFRDLPHQQQVRGSREEVAARTALTIDGSLHGTHELGCALDLVEGDWLRTAQQRIRIAPRSVGGVEVVERQVSPRPVHELSRERALPRLSRTGEHDRWHHPQPVLQARLDETWPVRLFHGVND